MLSMGRLFHLILLLNSIHCFSQIQLEVQHRNALFFYDEVINRFTVIDDSTGIHTYNLKTKNWEFQPYDFHLDIPFNDFLAQSIAVTRKGKTTLFVDEGCGIIYEFGKHSLSRIDNSFRHKNQYSSTVFVRNGDPYMFGGYGLFSFKNFFTHFDSAEKEWFKLIVLGVKPKPRRAATSVLTKDALFIFGGVGEVSEHVRSFNDCWKFSFTTNTWKKLGMLNPEIPQVFFWSRKNLIQDDLDNVTYYLTPERIFELRPKSNTAIVYQNTKIDKYQNILQEGPYLLLREFNNSTQKCSFTVRPKAAFFRPLISKEIPIYSNENKPNVWVAIGIAFIFIGLLVVWFIPKLKNRNTLLFSPTESQLVDLFFAKHNQGVEINLLNDLVNIGDPSIDTLKKRREQLLRELKITLSKHYQLDQNDIFREERMLSDKRMKIIFLNDDVFQKLLKLKKS